MYDGPDGNSEAEPSLFRRPAQAMPMNAALRVVNLRDRRRMVPPAPRSVAQRAPDYEAVRLYH